MTRSIDSADPESVWEYPRPPRLEISDEEITVTLAGREIARTSRSLRVLETSHPPTYYLPLDAFAEGVLHPTAERSVCEFKGVAEYFDLVVGNHVERSAAWHYPHPEPTYAALAAHVAIYPGRMERCTVDDETVRPQVGDFYGGWITSRVAGPFKGPPGTRGW